MHLQIATLGAASDAEWDQSWKSCASATFFHSRQWSGVWHDFSPEHYRPTAQRIVFNDGATAILPFTLARRFHGILPEYVLSAEGTYGGWLSALPLANAHARLIAAHLRTLSDLEWLTNPFEASVGSIDTGDTPYWTWAFDLRLPEEQLLERWRANKAAVLRKVRAAKNHGLRMERLSRERLPEFYDLYLECQQRWGGGSTFYPASLFRRLYAEASCDIWGVFHPTGRMVCGNIMLRSSWHAACWIAVARTADLNLRPYEFMYVSQIQHYKSAGIHWYDMNPSGGHVGVDQFKQRMGAERIKCSIVRRTSIRQRILAHARRKLRKQKGSEP